MSTYESMMDGPEPVEGGEIAHEPGEDTAPAGYGIGGKQGSEAADGYAIGGKQGSEAADGYAIGGKPRNDASEGYGIGGRSGQAAPDKGEQEQA